MNTKTARYVICEKHTGYEAPLTQDQVYEVIPDPAEDNGMIRVIDDSGEDCLLETDLFREIDNPSGIAIEIASDSARDVTATVAQLAHEIEQARIDAGLTTEELLAGLRVQRERYYAEHHSGA